MKNLNFKNVEYQQIETVETPEEYLAKKNNIDVKAGDCLTNSYEISRKFPKVDIVEGFLVTYFDDGIIESVGHVWNEIDGIYFDETIGLKNSDKKIIKNEYYLADKYTSNEIATEEKEKPRAGLSSLFEKPIIQKFIVFKTNVKKLESELREFLNNTEDTTIKNIKEE